MRFAHIVLIPLLVSGTAEQLCAADKNPKSNEEIMFQLCRDAVGTFVIESKIADTAEVFLQIESGEVNRFFTHTVIESFLQRFSSLFTQHGKASVECAVSIGEVTVSYGQPFSEGFLSTRKSERLVGVKLRLTATKNPERKILWAGTTSKSFSDTVSIDEIPKLQHSSEHIAKGVIPQRSMMERLIEPFIIVTAAGVAVYLFFTIRSS